MDRGRAHDSRNESGRAATCVDEFCDAIAAHGDAGSRESHACGANDRTSRALGGWKFPRMLDRYAHLSPAHLWQAIEGLALVGTGSEGNSTGQVLQKSMKRLERETGFEPATLALARRCSTTELFPLDHNPSQRGGILLMQERSCQAIWQATLIIVILLSYLRFNNSEALPKSNQTVFQSNY